MKRRISEQVGRIAWRLAPLWLSAAALAMTPTDAHADVTPEQRAEAERVCSDFANLVETHAGTCDILGEELARFIDAHEGELERFVGLEPADLEPVCLPHLEPTIEPIIGCLDSTTVADALVRLRRLHDEAIALSADQPNTP